MSVNRNNRAGSRDSPVLTPSLGFVAGAASAAEAREKAGQCGKDGERLLLVGNVAAVLEQQRAGAGMQANQPPDLVVHPSQFHGIEKNVFAAELAQVVVWIGYLQWKRKNGFPDFQEPILEHLDSIQCQDAILGVDAQGTPVPPVWTEADIIIGNPPFLGDKKMRAELGDAYVEQLRALYAGRVAAGVDLVSYWFERAREQLGHGAADHSGAGR